jgi:hypothetical protein
MSVARRLIQIDSAKRLHPLFCTFIAKFSLPFIVSPDGCPYFIQRNVGHVGRFLLDHPLYRVSQFGSRKGVPTVFERLKAEDSDGDDDQVFSAEHVLLLSHRQGTVAFCFIPSTFSRKGQCQRQQPHARRASVLRQGGGSPQTTCS